MVAFVACKLRGNNCCTMVTAEDKQGKQIEQLVLDVSILRCFVSLETLAPINTTMHDLMMKGGAAEHSPIDAFMLKHVLSMLMQDWKPKAQEAVFNQSMDKIEAEALALEALMPRRSHNITNTTYNGTLAKRQLLNAQMRAGLSKQYKRVYSLKSSLEAKCTRINEFCIYIYTRYCIYI